MDRSISKDYPARAILLDALVVAFSLVLAAFVRPLLSPLPLVKELEQPSPIPWFLYLLFPVCWVLLLALFSVYDVKKNPRFTDELTNLTAGSIIASLALAGALYFSFRDISRLQFLTFILFTFISLVIWRVIYRRILLSPVGIKQEPRKVLIVGTGASAREIFNLIKENPHLGYTAVGFLSDQPGDRVKNQHIYSTINEATELVQKLEIDDVVLTTPQQGNNQISNLVVELHNLPARVWLIPDYFHIALHQSKVDEFIGLPMINLRAPTINEYQRTAKRVFDILLTILFIPPGLILMTIISIAIRIESKGPIIFRQQRVGEHGRLFDMYKFRTMVPDAEKLRHLVEYFDEEGHLIHKREDDPRITRVGGFLRKTSLDELPQLINILKGEMSLVGPRPELPYLLDQYKPWQWKRFTVPQGITGWWQVNGRSDKPMHFHTEDDLYYIQNYSLVMDLYILLKTVLVVLRGEGAF